MMPRVFISFESAGCGPYEKLGTSVTGSGEVRRGRRVRRRKAGVEKILGFDVAIRKLQYVGMFWHL